MAPYLIGCVILCAVDALRWWQLKLSAYLSDLSRFRRTFLSMEADRESQSGTSIGYMQCRGFHFLQHQHARLGSVRIQSKAGMSENKTYKLFLQRRKSYF